MKEKKILITGIILILTFALWTVLITNIDVQPIGQKGTTVDFATINHLFHNITGTNMMIYYITDWLGHIPILCCLIFCVVGLVQLIKRKSFFKVDYDILCLGLYYIIVISGYLIFEIIPVNYRPVPIDGIMEASYPSSTTLLTLSVMPTVIFQAKRRISSVAIRKTITIISVFFSLFMTIGRTISGVHWLTDIIGSVLLSSGLYLIYKATILIFNKNQANNGGVQWNSTKNYRN